MRPQRLTEEQLYLMNYLHSSHRQIPVQAKDLSKLKIPFVAAVTPFPRDTQPPPTVPYPFQNAAVCKKCTALASNRYIKCPDGMSWLCQVCSNKNVYSEKNPPIDDSPQSKSTVFDSFLPKNPNEVVKIIPPCYKPDFFFLVIERSDATIENGIFKATLDKVRESIVDKLTGNFSIFFYDSYFHFPMIVGDRKTFSVSTVFDVEDAILPPAEACFFNLETDRELAYKYLDYLENAPIIPLMAKLYDVIKTVSSFASRARIPVVFLTSQSEVGTKSQYHDLAISILKTAVPLKFLCLTPMMAPPDFSPLSELSLILNSKVQIFSQSQISYLPTDVVNTLAEPTFVDVLLFSVISPYLKIVDVKGNGIRRSEFGYSVTYLSPNDTIYVYLDYKTSKIEVPAPAVQFQVRYIDSRRRKYVRTISSSYTLVDNMNTVATLCDYDVYIASCFIRCVDKAREFGSRQAALEELDKINDEFIGDKFARLFYYNLPALTRSKIENALVAGKNFLVPEYYPLITGRGPIDISLFFAPEAYIFDLYSTQMQGPFTLSGRNVGAGAMYIRLNNSRGLVLLADNQSIPQWVEAINQPPISELIASVCREKVIEIVSPSTSSDHNLYKHVITCINTKLKKRTL